MIADLAYTTGVIPEKRDQIAARARRERGGGHPPHLDERAYRGRRVVERSLAKQWRGLFTCYELAIATAPQAPFVPSSLGSAHKEDPPH